MNIDSQKKISAVNITFLVSISLSIVISILPTILHFINLNCGTGYSLAYYDYLIEHPVANILTGQLIVGIPLVAFLIANRINYIKLVRLNKMKVSNVLLVILFGFLIQPLLRFVNGLSLCFTNNEMADTMLDVTQKVPYLTGVFLVCILPGILEESFYRGAVFSSYREANPWKAVLLSGFLFGLMHGNINQFCYATVMGIIFALTIEATGSILSTMIIHFTTNFISITSMYILPKLYDTMKSLYQISVAMGQEEAFNSYKSLLGDMSLSSEEWMKSLLVQSAEVNLTFSSVFITYFPSAVIFSVLAFQLLRCISKRTGTWDRFRVTYLGADEVIVEAKQDTPYEKEHIIGNTNGDSALHIMTTPLMIAIAIGICFIFFTETLKYIPQ